MATEFGTAVNHADLVERFIQFLTARAPTWSRAGQAYERFSTTSSGNGHGALPRRPGQPAQARAWAAPIASRWGS
ncbi:hypothetical protein P4054_29695 [Pseudomonas aeruginosa]|nr:hypothetical protein [Pseudomonas aeruginosa]